MPLCPNGQKAIIEWQYPGEDKQQILGADDYTIGQEQGKCNTSYLVTGIAARNGINYCQTPVLNNNWSLNVVGVVHGLKAQFIRQDDRYSCPNYTSIVGKANFQLAYLSFGNNPNNSSLGIIYFYEPHTINDVVKITSIVRTDGQPDNCGNCVFTVTKNGQVVYTRTKSPCPTLTHTCGEQCPPGSCECSCGTEICCYHPTTGAVVKSFTR